MSEQTTLDTMVELAMTSARTDALLDAEKVVRDRIGKLTSFQLSEARTLKLAANDIAALRANSWKEM